MAAYFSVSGVTRKVAGRLADIAGADLYEIEPEAAYTKADFNWMDERAADYIVVIQKWLLHW